MNKNNDTFNTVDVSTAPLGPSVGDALIWLAAVAQRIEAGVILFPQLGESLSFLLDDASRAHLRTTARWSEITLDREIVLVGPSEEDKQWATYRHGKGFSGCIVATLEDGSTFPLLFTNHFASPSDADA